MAMIVHMTVEGKSQGLISQGCSPREGREDTIHVMQVEQAIEVPWNDQDGRAQGRRIHRPLKLLKAIDRSSPMLANALCSNETLTITLHFYRYNPDGDGLEEQYYTLLLEEANVVAYRAELPFTLDEAKAQYPALEHLELAFTKITATFERDGVSYSDSWKSPRV